MKADKEVWLEDLAKHRKFLFQCVLSAGASEHSPNDGVRRDCGCMDRSYPRPHETDRHHDPRCKHGLLLRLLGGPAVALRQLNASHELALMMDAEESRLKNIANLLLEISASGAWIGSHSKQLEDLKMRNLISVRVLRSERVEAALTAGTKATNLHETMHLIRSTRAHEQCWDCDMYSLHGEDSPGHCKHCDQDWPPSGSCAS